MSLSQQIYQGGHVGDWWLTSGADFGDVTSQIAQRAARPVPGLSTGGLDHAAAVGSIVSRMIERAVQPAPAYAAILGGGSADQATLWPSHANLPAERRPNAVAWRPTPGGWSELVPAAPDAAHTDLVADAAAMENDPAATIVDRATAAGALVSVEHRYRSPTRTLGTLDSTAVTDAVRIYRGMSASTEQARRLAGGEVRGYAAPVFAPHWADGDVLLGPDLTDGHCLVEIKTVGRSTATRSDRTALWIQQALSYVACDIDEDLWQIRKVGVWLPRQDVLTVWPVDELLSQLGLSRRALRSLGAACEQAYLSEAVAAGWQAG